MSSSRHFENKTQKKFIDAFVLLYSGGEKRKFSVTMLCTAADINRSYFYKCFESGDDFLAVVRTVFQNNCIDAFHKLCKEDSLPSFSLFQNYIEAVFRQFIVYLRSIYAVMNDEEFFHFLSFIVSEIDKKYYQSRVTQISDSTAMALIYGIFFTENNLDVILSNRKNGTVQMQNISPENTSSRALKQPNGQDNTYDICQLYKVSSYNVVDKSLHFAIYNVRTEESVLLSDDVGKWYESVCKQKEFLLPNFNSTILKLIDKGFVVPAVFDEAKWVLLKHREVVYGTSSLSVTILPTNNCNFRCVYCYENPETNVMSLETEEKLIHFFERKVPDVKQVKISWFGGEPLLYPELVIRIQRKILEICRNNHVSMLAAINTNGYTLTADIFRQLVLAHVTSFEICIDGPEELHNRKRPHYQNSDSYQRIIKNLTEIKEKIKTNFYSITLRCNVSSDSAPFMEKHIQILSNLFAGDKRFRIYFQGVRDWGGSRDAKENMPESEESIINTWYDKAAEAGLCSAEAFPLTPFEGYCEAQKLNSYVVNYDGTLHKCTIAMFGQDKEIGQIGYLDDGGRPHLDEGKVAQWLVEPLQENTQKCYKCVMYPLCVGGSCPYQRNIKCMKKCNHLESLIRAKLRCMQMKSILISEMED